MDIRIDFIQEQDYEELIALFFNGFVVKNKEN